MFHIAALPPMLATFDVGGAYLTMTHFEAGPALEMLERKTCDGGLYRRSSRSCPT